MRVRSRAIARVRRRSERGWRETCDVALNASDCRCRRLEKIEDDGGGFFGQGRERAVDNFGGGGERIGVGVGRAGGGSA